VTETYTIGAVKNGITTIVFSEDPTFDVCKAVIDELAATKSYHFRLWDFSEVLFTFSMDEIKAIARYGKARFLDKNRLAAVAPQDVAYGMLRAFEVYRDEDAHSVARVFRKEEEARAWLKEQQVSSGFRPNASEKA